MRLKRLWLLLKLNLQNTQTAHDVGAAQIWKPHIERQKRHCLAAPGSTCDGSWRQVIEVKHKHLKQHGLAAVRRNIAGQGAATACVEQYNAIGGTSHLCSASIIDIALAGMRWSSGLADTN